MKTNRKMIFAVVSVCCLCLVSCKNNKSSFSLQTTELKSGSISSSVTATGTIEPITTVEVGTQVSGIISEIYVDYNSVVTKGEILAEIDKVNLQAELTSCELDVKNSRIEYDYQKKNFTRTEKLHEQELISDTEYETEKYNYEKAETTYKRNLVSLQKAQTNLGYATITSPIDGVVLSRAVEEGQTVAASFSTPTLFTIANDLTKMRVVADVDEADIGDVMEGQRVSFTVDAYPNDIFEGEVTQVRLEATTTSNVVTYEVIVNAPNNDLKLKPGLTANITIYTLEKNNISILQNKAFNFIPDKDVLEQYGYTMVAPNHDKPADRPAMPDSLAANDRPTTPPELPANKKMVWVLNDKQVTGVMVETGDTDGINTEIKSGLENGAQVILGSETISIDMSEAPSGEQSPFMPQRPGDKKK